MRKWLLGLGFLALMGAPAVEAQSGSSVAFYYRLCQSPDVMDGFACDQYFVGVYTGIMAATIKTRQIPFCGVINAGQIRTAFMEMAAATDQETLKLDAAPFTLAALNQKYAC